MTDLTPLKVLLTISDLPCEGKKSTCAEANVRLSLAAEDYSLISFHQRHNVAKDWWQGAGPVDTRSVATRTVSFPLFCALCFLLWPREDKKKALFAWLTLEGRDGVIVREMALEGIKASKHKITMRQSDSKTLLGREGRKTSGGGKQIEERELSQIECVCLGWH